MSYYYDNEPGMSKLAGAGAAVGVCVAIVITSTVALAQWLAGAQLSAALDWALQLLLLLSTLGASLGALFALIYYTRRLLPQSPLEQEEKIDYYDPYPAQQVEEERQQPNTLAEHIVANVTQQAFWHYNYNKNPSRRAMGQEGVPQAIWNSARAVLCEAGILHGDKWSAQGLAGLKRIYADGDKIWVPNDHGLRAIVVSEKLIGNSYIDPNQLENRVFDQPNHSNRVGGVGR